MLSDGLASSLKFTQASSGSAYAVWPDHSSTNEVFNLQSAQDLLMLVQGKLV